jgi:PAS domain-containing protein
MIFLTDVIPASDLNTLYTGFITLIVLLVNAAISRLLNKKHKAETSLQLESISKEVKETKKELSTNGGDTTMKDVLNNVNTKLDQLHKKTESIERKVQQINAQARARTELALDQSNVPQFLANENGEVDYVNDAMTELFGLGKNHCMVNKWMVAIESQTVKEEIIRRLSFAIKNKFLFKFDVSIKNQKTGNSVNSVFTVEPRLDSEGNFLWNLGKFKEVPQTT